MISTNKARQSNLMPVVKMGLAGLTTISWLAGVTYLGQLAGDASPAHTSPMLPFVLFTFVAGFYYGERRAPAGFYYAGRRRQEVAPWQVWLAGLTIPVVLHWLVYRLFFEGSVDSAGVSGLSVLLNSILLMTTWWWAVSSSTELRGLDVHPEELPDSRGFRHEHPAASRYRQTCFRRLRDRWIAGAIVLAGVIAILGSLSRDYHLPVLEVGLYLVAGFGLLALSNLVRSGATWRIEQIRLPDMLARRWMSSALAFIAFGAAMATLLPTGYARIFSGMFASLTGTLNSVSISLPSPPSQPNRDSGVILPRQDPLLIPQEGSREPVRVPPEAPSAASPGPDLSLPETVVIIGLLILGTGLVFITIRAAWGRRIDLRVLEVLEDLVGISWLVLLAIIDMIRDVIYVSGQIAQSGIDTAATRRLQFHARMPAFRLRSLDEREWLEYMVLSLFRRAEKLGHHRPSGMTAIEYASRLRRELAIAGPELSLLIDRFHHSRYGEHSPSTDEVNEAKRWWIRLKSALQRVRVRVSIDKPKPQKNRPIDAAALAQTDSPLKSNSGESTGRFRVVDTILGIVRAIFLVALFLVGLVAIIAIPAILAGVLDPGAFVR